MISQERPGGLTALAVINFVWGGFSILASLGSLIATAVFGRMGQMPPEAAEDMTEQELAQIEGVLEIAPGLLLAFAALGLISAALLIASGIGYLKQKRVLGRTVGTAYGVFGIVSTLLPLLWLPDVMGGRFGIGTIIGLVYPVLTLILINTTFRDDLVN